MNRAFLKISAAEKHPVDSIVNMKWFFSFWNDIFLGYFSIHTLQVEQLRGFFTKIC